jgi:gamma-glutamyltranspeptidase/glutathione hydrolase
VVSSIARESAWILGSCVVAASQPRAAEAGIEMMRRGGNAVDAAIAAAAALMVVEPVSSGLGADAFAIVCDRSQLFALNASGRSPRNSVDFAGDRIPEFGWASVTIPGAVSGWVALLERFGTFPMSELLAPAVELARNGYEVTPTVARVWRGLAASYMKFPEVVTQFYAGGRGPNAGSRVRLPDLADTLEMIGQTAGASFYRGDLAARIAEYSSATGGTITLEDLQAHRAEWVEPVHVFYHNARVYEMPPNSQGLAALIALGILEHFDLGNKSADSSESVHLQIEAMKLAFVDTYRHVADRAAMHVGPEELLSPKRLGALARKISTREARFPATTMAPASGGTTYLCTADANGMAVSYIQSSGPGFGSGVMIPGTGIALQNRGSAFDCDANHPNAYAPEKRPFHSNCPAFLMGESGTQMAFGCMGWSMQPQAHVQFVVHAIDHRWTAPEILSAPRWRIAVAEPAILLEEGFPQATAVGLASLGHRIVQTEKFFAASTPFGSQMMFGGANMVCRTPAGWIAACDPRRDGLPANC